jgi:hypothetical protein
MAIHAGTFDKVRLIHLAHQYQVTEKQSPNPHFNVVRFGASTVQEAFG